MYKKLLLALLFLLPTTALAAPTSWDYSAGILQPLQSMWTALVKADRFQATSTTQASVFPLASTTALTATSLCLSGDLPCRTTWPTGGSGGLASTTPWSTPGDAFVNSLGLIYSSATSSASTAYQSVWRDANVNAFANNFLSRAESTVSAGGTTVLTAASGQVQRLTGSSNQTFKLPDATTLTLGTWYKLDNNSSGSLIITDAGGSTLYTVPAGGYVQAAATSIATSDGGWDFHPYAPATVTWGSGATGLVMNSVLSTSPSILAGASSAIAPSFIPQRGAATTGLGGDGSGLFLTTAGTARLTVLSGGAVGIASTTPTTNLLVIRDTGKFSGTVTSDLVAAFADNGDAGLAITSGASNVARLYLGGDGASSYNNGRITYNASTNAMGFETADSEKLTILTGGNVGVASTTPWGLLSVNPSALGTGVPEFVIGSSTSTHLLVDGAGKVGIGTTSPQALLHVSGGNLYIDQTKSIKFLRAANNTAYTIIDTPTQGGGNGITFGQSTGFVQDFNFINNGGTILTMNTSANSGFGTTTPAFKLQVAAATAPQLALSDGSLTSNHWTMRNTGGTLYVATSSPLTYATSTTPALTINTSGFVGIGTTTPGTTLSVQGVANFSTATTTHQSTGGIDLKGGGCYAINGVCVGTGNVTGTGVAQQVAYWNGTSALTGDTGFTWDSTNGLHAISNAITSGSESYTAFGATNNESIRMQQNNSTAANANFLSQPETGLLIAGTSDTGGLGLMTRANAPIQFITGGTAFTNERARITGTGFMGIGSTTPWGLLSVNPSGITSGAPFFTVGSSTATNFIVDSIGRTGVATTSPYAQLAIGGDVAIGASTAGGTLGSLYLPGLATPAGTIVAADATGKLIATTSQMTISNGGGLLISGSPLKLGGTLTITLNTSNSNTWGALQNFNGGTPATSASIGSSTPFGLFSINPTTSLGTAPAFVIGSSTGTLFGIGSAGNIILNEQRPATSTAIVLDWVSTPAAITYQIGTSATTITLINATTTLQAGSRKLVTVCNPGTTAGAITWAGVEWAGGTVPTQTTTASQCDAYSFYTTSATSTTAYKVFGAMTPGFK